MKKRLPAFFLALVMALALLAISAAAADASSGSCGADGDNVTWELSSGTLTISGSGAMADYSVYTTPGYPKAPWMNLSFTDVEIQKGVTSIGNSAFNKCADMKSITIPSSVTEIAPFAFNDCTGLTSVTIPESVTEIKISTFSGCTSLTSVTIPNSVTIIRNSAFSGCENLTSVTIPGSVARIGDSAFSDCGRLTDVTISDGVESIGHSAFKSCGNLTSITFPNSVTSIGDHAFIRCYKLADVTLSESLESIEAGTFSFCSSLKSITIPDGVKTIGASAFYTCTGLTDVTIPASVTSIGGSAFAGCPSLKNVNFTGTEAQWKASSIADSMPGVSINYISAGAALEPSPEPAQPAKFTDVPVDKWYYDAVAWAVEKGITGGTSENTFGPNDTCTEIQILTFLWRAAGKPAVDVTLPVTVTGAVDYVSAAKWAYSKGMIDSSFKQGSPCTRASAVKFIWQAAGSPAAGTASFSDVPAGAVYAQAVAWAVEKGITVGASENAFDPDGTCTRAQIVTFLYRDRAN